jgi:hypothetical protein
LPGDLAATEKVLAFTPMRFRNTPLNLMDNIALLPGG